MDPFRYVKAEFLNKFLRRFPDFYRITNECQHAYDENKLNPYHMENDLWSHLMLVLNNIKLFRKEDCIENQELIDAMNSVLILVSLTHDWGKISCIKRHDEKNKVSFYGHGPAGTQFTIDAANTMFSKHPLLSTIVYYSSFITSQHMDVHDHIDVDNPDLLNRILRFCNNDKHLAMCMLTFMCADSEGQISTAAGENKNKICIVESLLEELKNFNIDNSVGVSPIKSRTVFVYSGLPGSGKDTLANKRNQLVLSYDNIRVFEYLMSKKSRTDLAMSTIYKEAWNWCRVNAIDMDKRLSIELKILPKTDKDIAICNLSSTPNVRRNLVSRIRGAFVDEDIEIVCIAVAAPSVVIKKRDSERLSKHVTPTVIDDISKRYSIPSMSEGFDRVEFIWNVGKND